MKNSKKVTLILAALAVVVLAVCGWLYLRPKTAKAQGKVTICVKDIEEKTLSEKTVEFFEGDTLETLVKANFSGVVITDGMVMEIEGLTTPADWSTFISIYTNGEMSMVGILDIPLSDGLRVDFMDTKMSF